MTVWPIFCAVQRLSVRPSSSIPEILPSRCWGVVVAGVDDGDVLGGCVEDAVRQVGHGFEGDRDDHDVGVP